MKTVLFIADPEVRINQQIAVGLSRELQRHEPWQLTLLPKTTKPPVLLRFLRATPPQAVVSHAYIADPKSRKALQDLSVPWVAVAVDHHPELPIPVVIPDEEAIGARAAEHLLSLRFQHFAIVGFRASANASRFNVFRRRIAQSQKTLDTYLLPTPRLGREDHPSNIGGNQTRLIRWLQRLPKPCAIFAHSDQPGAHVIRICGEHGIPVPEEISVLAVDDDALFCHTVHPNLASIHVSNTRIGAEAARLLREWRPGRRVVKIPPAAVIERGSIRAPQLPDPLIEQAIEHARAHVGDGVRVRDLQKLTGLTPQLLVYRFQRAIRASPIEVILRQRILLARQLLSETGDPVSTIARRCGFRSANQFYVTFRNHVGMSPVEYRAQFSP
jgi:LacI family transcriptional regulator